MLTISDKYKESEKSISYYAKNGFETFLIYVPKEKNNLNSGDKIKVSYRKMDSEFLNNYNEFNYDLYLKSIGVVARLYIDDFELVNSNNVYSYFLDFKEYISNIFDENVSGLVLSISSGDKELLNEKLKELFNLSGVSHILVVSGSAIYILKKFLKKFMKKIKYREILEVIVIIIYTIFCSFSVSILRAFLVYIISFFFKILKKEKSRIIYVIVSIIIMLIINPYYIFNISFLYSNIAVFSIILIMPIISSKLRVIHLKLYNVRHERYINKKFKFKLEKYLLNSFSLTISIQLFLLPLNLYLGNSINILSLFSNLIVNILYLPQFILCFLLILTFKIPFINSCICYILNFSSKILIYISNFFSNFSFLNINLNKPWLITVILIYIIIIYIFYGYVISFKLKYKFNSLKKYKLISKIFFVLIIIILILNIYFSYFTSFVYYFNIGQGNMSLIKDGNSVVIFDIGSSTNDVSAVLTSFLKAYNIKKIDYIFLSHMHQDHINGLYNLKDELLNRKIEIGSVCANSIDKEMMDFLKELNINYIELKKNDKLKIGNIVAEILSPEYENEINSKDILNANSMVTSFNINGKKILYMGDATKETEEKMVINSGKSDYFILQVGHHGSSTSTSKNFLQKFSFKYAVISSKKKVYNHPAESTILNLYQNNIKYIILEERGGTRFWL